MKKIRLLTLSIVLATFASTTWADGCIPGNTQSPPCLGGNSLQTDPETAGQTVNSVTTTPTSTTDIATELTLDLVQTVLAIF